MDDDVIATAPTLVEARALFKAAGVLTPEDLSIALAAGAAYGPLVDLYNHAFARLKTHLKPFISDSAHAVTLFAQAAKEKPSLLSKLWLKKQLYSTEAPFIRELKLTTDTALRYGQWPALVDYSARATFLYRWLFNMFGLCPFVFCKLLLSMVFGEGAREAIMIIW